MLSWDDNGILFAVGQSSQGDVSCQRMEVEQCAILFIEIN